MKYKSVQLSNGKYAVKSTKNRYFVDTVRDTKAEAQEQALIMSIQYYDNKAREAYKILVKGYPEKYAGMYDGESGGKSNYGDLLC